VSRHAPQARKDRSHDEVVATFRALGCSVAETHLPPVDGFPDTLVGCVGLNHLVEIKSDSSYGKRGLNDNQSAFARDWRGGRVHLCRNRDEAAALVQNWRRQAGGSRHAPTA
jgi:hypothetical protein